jgi:aminoglycoside phosphotransferase (APT) family kinase protein
MADPVQPGEVIRDKYRVEHVLGRGGMGLVVAAAHLRLDQRVALKILRPELRVHADVVERFQREARAASKMEGAHVARVLDVDTLDDGTPFFVMEYLEGTDLSYVRRSRRPMPPAEAAACVIEACDAIEEAHALTVHRARPLRGRDHGRHVRAHDPWRARAAAIDRARARAGPGGGSAAPSPASSASASAPPRAPAPSASQRRRLFPSPGR